MDVTSQVHEMEHGNALKMDLLEVTFFIKTTNTTQIKENSTLTIHIHFEVCIYFLM